jgi:hypothetical protein
MVESHRGLQGKYQLDNVGKLGVVLVEFRHHHEDERLNLI